MIQKVIWRHVHVSLCSLDQPLPRRQEVSGDLDSLAASSPASATAADMRQHHGIGYAHPVDVHLEMGRSSWDEEQDILHYVQSKVDAGVACCVCRCPSLLVQLYWLLQLLHALPAAYTCQDNECISRPHTLFVMKSGLSCALVDNCAAKASCLWMSAVSLLLQPGDLAAVPS